MIHLHLSFSEKSKDKILFKMYKLELKALLGKMQMNWAKTGTRMLHLNLNNFAKISRFKERVKHQSVRSEADSR